MVQTVTIPETNTTTTSSPASGAPVQPAIAVADQPQTKNCGCNNHRGEPVYSICIDSLVWLIVGLLFIALLWKKLKA